MKTLFYLWMVLLSVGLLSCAETKKESTDTGGEEVAQVLNSKQTIPEAVLTTFQTKFQNATEVIWDQENENEWEAEFKLEGVAHAANFDVSGTWLETEKVIGIAEVPAAVIAILKKDFADYDVDEMEISETASGMLYEFELERGETTIDVTITPEGVVQKNVAANDDPDDDDNDDD
ncbi:MAG: PepSY-like domain-containing protein [Altibacter sp.]|uniref:PepSY-like domain-containing protein n=1 Tax=Altibacter sp. TaxID=2024823 RepID=UPI001DC1AD03|nr:PepSY-like domain-containing protein [Altibacter sp.]MBZ0327861.1 PepSY-like domain-containing protein [Altibacter sp.]